MHDMHGPVLDDGSDSLHLAVTHIDGASERQGLPHLRCFANDFLPNRAKPTAAAVTFVQQVDGKEVAQLAGHEHAQAKQESLEPLQLKSITGCLFEIPACGKKPIDKLPRAVNTSPLFPTYLGTAGHSPYC